jgi:hypothetical protein
MRAPEVRVVVDGALDLMRVVLVAVVPLEPVEGTTAEAQFRTSPARDALVVLRLEVILRKYSVDSVSTNMVRKQE